jgi:hypothetical protein
MSKKIGRTGGAENYMALFTVEEAAKVLGVNEDQVLEDVRSGALKAVIIDKGKTGEERVVLDVEEAGLRTAEAPTPSEERNSAEQRLLDAIFSEGKNTDEVKERYAEALGTQGRGSASSTRRLNVVFSESAYNTIKDLADQSGKTISDVVRDALALQKWFIDVRRKGGRILVEERGRVREILNIR